MRSTNPSPEASSRRSPPDTRARPARAATPGTTSLSCPQGSLAMSFETAPKRRNTGAESAIAPTFASAGPDTGTQNGQP